MLHCIALHCIHIHIRTYNNQVLTKPKGNEFNFDPANDYYKQFKAKEHDDTPKQAQPLY